MRRLAITFVLALVILTALGIVGNKFAPSAKITNTVRYAQDLPAASRVHQVRTVLEASPSISDACRPDDIPYLGITYLPVTDTVARYYNLSQADGALLTAVAPNSPAARAGLRPGDIILAFDGQAIRPDTSLLSLLMSYQIGAKVVLTVSREGAVSDVSLVLTRRPGG